MMPVILGDMGVVDGSGRDTAIKPNIDGNGLGLKRRRPVSKLWGGSGNLKDSLVTAEVDADGRHE
jgi:hypothetical protein